MPNTYLAIPTGVHIILTRHDHAVLLLRRAGTGFFDGLYSLPGGHLEPGEQIMHTAIREARDELGVTLALQDLQYGGVVHRSSDTHRIDFFVQTYIWQGKPYIAEPDKCDALLWVLPGEIPKQTVPYIQIALARHWQMIGTEHASNGWFFEEGFTNGPTV